MRVTVNTENTEYDCDLGDLLWGKGFSTYRKIRDANLLEELICYLENIFSDGEDITVINNYLAYEFDVNKFIATNTRLCDMPSIEALMYYANKLGYPKAYNNLKTSDRTELWGHLVANYYDYTLDMLFSKAI